MSVTGMKIYKFNEYMSVVRPHQRVKRTPKTVAIFLEMETIFPSNKPRTPVMVEKMVAFFNERIK